MPLTIPPHIRGLIFDCDGTIADTMPLHFKAWVQAFREYEHVFPEAMFYEMAGIPTVRIIEILNDKHGFKLPVQATADRKESLYLEQVQLVGPIEPVVRIVHAYHGKLPMAVATGGTRAICVKTLDALRLTNRFDAIVTADDVLNGKPAPDIFLEAARLIRVEPAACCVFEDADLGVQAGIAAGMTVIDVRNVPTIGYPKPPRA